MKKVLNFFAAAAVLLFSVSCNKDDNSPSEKAPLTQQETMALLDSAGVKVLQQIEAADFKNLIYIVKDGITAFEGKGISVEVKPDAKTNWQTQMDRFVVGTNSTGGKNYVFDGDLLCGVATLKLTEGDSSINYTFDTGKSPISFEVVSNVNYNGKLKITCDKKDSICLGMYASHGRLKAKDTLYTHLPVKVENSISFSGKEYISGTLNTDFSAMSGWDLSDFWSIFLNLDQMAFSMEGDQYINGTNSYKLRVNNFALANFTVTADLTLCGKDGSALVDIDGNVYLEENEEGGLPEIKTNGWNFDFMSGMLAVKILNNKAEFYFKGYDKAQMTVDIATQNIAFADGTTSTVEEFFKPGNFSDTVRSALVLALEFYNMIKDL